MASPIGGHNLLNCQRQKPPPGLTHHSYRGSQYAAADYPTHAGVPAHGRGRRAHAVTPAFMISPSALGENLTVADDVLRHFKDGHPNNIQRSRHIPRIE
jgi:hypothetical protein